MSITDDRRRVALETLRDCCAAAKNSPAAALLLWGSVRPLATDYADLNAWAGRREAESRNGYDFGFWMATGLEWRRDKIGLLAMQLVYIHRLVRRAERVGVDQAFADAGLHDSGGQVANIQIGDAKGRTNLEAVLNLARMALSSAGVGVLKELPRDRAEAVAQLTESMLVPVWDDGSECPKGVRVSKKILAMLGQHDAHSIKLALETEHAKIEVALGLQSLGSTAGPWSVQELVAAVRAKIPNWSDRTFAAIATDSKIPRPISGGGGRNHRFTQRDVERLVAHLESRSCSRQNRIEIASVFRKLLP